MFANSVVRAVLPYVTNGWMRLLRRTMRIRFLGREIVEGFVRAEQPYILAFWHGRLFLIRYAFPGHRVTILISRHRDGELIARTAELFGMHASRGSTTEGGAAGLREIVRRVREGYSVGFTPDGPRGPRHVAQPGVVQAARLARVPIVPVGFGASKKNS